MNLVCSSESFFDEVKIIKPCVFQMMHSRLTLAYIRAPRSWTCPSVCLSVSSVFLCVSFDFVGQVTTNIGPLRIKMFNFYICDDGSLQNNFSGLAPAFKNWFGPPACNVTAATQSDLTTTLLLLTLHSRNEWLTWEDGGKTVAPIRRFLLCWNYPVYLNAPLPHLNWVSLEASYCREKGVT